METLAWHGVHASMVNDFPTDEYRQQSSIKGTHVCLSTVVITWVSDSPPGPGTAIKNAPQGQIWDQRYTPQDQDTPPGISGTPLGPGTPPDEVPLNHLNPQTRHSMLESITLSEQVALQIIPGTLRQKILPPSRFSI